MAYFLDQIRAYAVEVVHDFDDFAAFHAELVAFCKSLPAVGHPAFNVLQYQQLCSSVGVWAWQHKTTTVYAKPIAATPSLRPTARRDQVLALRAQGRTYHQIAEQTGWSEMTIAGIIRDAHPRPGPTDQPPAI